MSSSSIKRIVAIGSGKGGVGKSTTAVNLSLALAAKGQRVGLLDADIYGPNVPSMLGVAHLTPVLEPGKKLRPIVSHGLKTMSIANLVDEHQAMIWRGPMASSALQQLFNDTLWGELDVLMVDLPPGTGDIPLTMAQKFSLTAAVVVTTPQDIALLDVKKALNMFEKTKVPVLGLIENMSCYTCPACGHNETIFGSGGAERLSTAERPLFGQLPLWPGIAHQMDQGDPWVVAYPEHAITQLYHQIAQKLIDQLEKFPVRPQPSPFPKIVTT